ncbi:DUF2075 domain-containing protein [Enterococcus sp. S86.2]|uniref:DUF2075 domain-containing protein n=1 Tax=Enterococcus sp. S86.2 TaxID=3031299 RepID=UPI0026ED4A29|nr:DUF2075 domain-containing protein [Enterococcus sp. S86.2]
METLTSSFILPKTAKLDDNQQNVVRKILDFSATNIPCDKTAVFVLSGEAGAGKSIVLASAFEKLQKLSRQPNTAFSGFDNKLLVNHNEMLKIYKELAQQSTYLYKKDFMKPTPFINHYQKEHKKAEIIMIDEGHLLLSKSDPFNKFQQTNQLVEIMKLAKVVILVFDFAQVIKLKSYWQPNWLKSLLKDYPTQYYYLDQQYRLQDAKVTDWINAFVKGHLVPKPTTKNFELEFFADGLSLYEKIKTKNQQFGLSRLLATTDFPFTVLDDKKWFVTAGNLKLPWDKLNFTDRPWAERPETINEVGSIYTIQGFDLNYAGVILGPSVKYDEAEEKIYIDSNLYEDHEAFKTRTDVASLAKAKNEIVANSINILFKRGKFGLYIYATDATLRKHLLALKNTKI